MKKRLLPLLLSAALALPLGLMPARADVYDVPQREKAAVLKELEIMVGDENGALHLDRSVTRAEFTKLLMAASPYKDAVGQSAATDPYPDVSHKSWYAPYVRMAVDTGLVKGDEKGWFHPEDTISLREGATMAVRLLGYQDSDFNAPWPAGQMALFHALDLDAGVSAQGWTDPLTRQDCLHIFYDLLCAKTKAGQSYVNLLGAILNQDGEVDVAAVFKITKQEGPIPLTGTWKSLLPFRAEDALLYRDGERAELADLREWDLLYWAKAQPVLFAFSGSQGAMGQLTASVEGPVVAEGSWKSKLPFELTDATPVTRNGARASIRDIAGQDVVYWSKYTKALYVYAKTVSGTVEAVSPSLAAPSAVTIAGVPYPLETFEAQYAFSDLGPWRKGDAVTLLMGRTGGVAAVRALETGETSRVGVVSALESRTYTDQSDKPYASKVVVITGADGQSYTYPYNWSEHKKDGATVKQFEPGELVEVTLSGGQADVHRLSRAPISGTFNAAGTLLGTTPISPNADILDTYGSYTTKTIAPSRLAGVTLSGNMVRWHQVDEAGAITALILDDVTGDTHTYGVLTDAQVTPSTLGNPLAALMPTMTAPNVYTLDIAGRTQALSVSGKQFPVQKGPCLLGMDGMEVRDLRSLDQVAGVTLSGQSALAEGKSWPLADNVQYYIYKDSTYTLASRSQVLDSGYPLSAWYDALPSAGGRVRVILARER